MTVREQLSEELEKAPDSLIEEILDFYLFVKQRQQAKAIALTLINNEPMLIPRVASNSILVSEDDWRGIQETIYLLSIPRMGESIVEGLSTPLSDCSETLEW